MVKKHIQINFLRKKKQSEIIWYKTPNKRSIQNGIDVCACAYVQMFQLHWIKQPNWKPSILFEIQDRDDRNYTVWLANPCTHSVPWCIGTINGHTRICRIIVIKPLYFRFDCRVQLNDTFQVLITYLNDHPCWGERSANPVSENLLLLLLHSILFLFGHIISFGYLSVNRLLCVTSQS